MRWICARARTGTENICSGECCGRSSCILLPRKGLKEYEQDRHRLIGDLIDVVHTEDATKMEIWSTLKVEDDIKRKVFVDMLFGHFKCTQLNTINLVKMSCVLVERESLKIDMTRFEMVVMSDEIDGRIFDKKLTILSTTKIWAHSPNGSNQWVIVNHSKYVHCTG